jgi:hypothetical protein
MLSDLHWAVLMVFALNHDFPISEFMDEKNRRNLLDVLNSINLMDRRKHLPNKIYKLWRILDEPFAIWIWVQKWFWTLCRTFGFNLAEIYSLWSHGVADRVVLFEAGQAGPPFLQSAGMSCEFMVIILQVPFSLPLQASFSFMFGFCLTSELSTSHAHLSGISRSGPFDCDGRANLSSGVDQGSSKSISG